MMSSMLLLADVDSNGHMGWDGGWWIVMAIGMILLWSVVIAGIVWLVREFSHSRSDRPAIGGDRRANETDATAILDRRLAEGAISPEEYRERRAVLRGEAAPSPGAE